MVSSKVTKDGVVIVGTANAALIAGALATGAPTWVVWTLIALAIPTAVLATLLVVERVRH